MNNPKSTTKSVLTSLPVWVAAFGNFVAVFVLVLFGILRNESLLALGVPEADLLSAGTRLLNFQMSGMLIGGILWGFLGDRKGRVSVLFGSILLYSVASIANAFVNDVETYALLRFIAGIGLAGEFGAGVALLSEILNKENRGIGTTLVAAVGMAGAVVAAMIGHSLSWKAAYFIGGGLGLILLLLRARLIESETFQKSKQSGLPRGNFLILFQDRQRALIYFRCIAVGVPIWFIAGVLMIFAPEFATELGVTEPVKAGTSIMLHCLFAFPGNLAAGFLSQKLRSRLKTIHLFLAMMGIYFLMLFSMDLTTANQFYVLCGFSGFAAGYFGLFVTMAAEQFGTNIRATVATTVPNFVRASVVPLTLLLTTLRPLLGFIPSAAVISTACLVTAVVSLLMLKETFGKNLDYQELSK